jgi:cytochrome c biogenesis protein
VRDTPAEQFRYLRVPADEKGSMDGFLRLRAALEDPPPASWRCAAMQPRPPIPRPELAEQLAAFRRKALALFAGRENGRARPRGGLQAVSDFMEANVPEAERARAGEVLVRILNGALFELLQLTREQARAKP